MAGSKKTLFILLFLVSAKFCAGQSKPPNANFVSFGAPIAVPKIVFDSIISQGIILLKTKKNKSLSDWVFLVRIYNTFDFNHPADSAHIKFDELFRQDSDKAILALNAHLSKGMGYYSRQYDIDIGGAHVNNNSKYTVIY